MLYRLCEDFPILITVSHQNSSPGQNSNQGIVNDVFLVVDDDPKYLLRDIVRVFDDHEVSFSRNKLLVCAHHS